MSQVGSEQSDGYTSDTTKSGQLENKLEVYTEQTRNAKWWTVAQYTGEAAVEAGVVAAPMPESVKIMTTFAVIAAASLTSLRAAGRLTTKAQYREDISQAKRDERIVALMPTFKDPNNFDTARQLLLLEEEKHKLTRKNYKTHKEIVQHWTLSCGFRAATRWLDSEGNKFFSWPERLALTATNLADHLESDFDRDDIRVACKILDEYFPMDADQSITTEPDSSNWFNYVETLHSSPLEMKELHDLGWAPIASIVR